jgi:DNA-directed RNA polymerase specialized sigma24 family protein
MRCGPTLEMEDMEMSLEAVLEPETSTVAHRPRADRDLDLLAALRLHEPTAAERLVTTYGERAYRLATRITGSEPDAEEVVQDAFWTVVRKIDTFRGESAFGSWLYRIVANAAYQKLRGRQSRGRDLSLDEVLPSFDAQGRHVGPRGRPLGPD